MKKLLLLFAVLLPLIGFSQGNLDMKFRKLTADSLWLRKKPGWATTDTSAYKVLYRRASDGKMFEKGLTGGGDTVYNYLDSLYYSKATINTLAGFSGTKALKSVSDTGYTKTTGDLLYGNYTFNSGNIGIGTTPSYKLDVQSADVAVLHVGRTGGTPSGFYFGAWSTSGGGYIWSNNVTRSATNYAFIADATTTTLNAVAELNFQIRTSNEMKVSANTLQLGGTAAAKEIKVINAGYTAAGQNLNVHAGNTIAGGTADLNGGMTTINPGISKGTGFSSVRLGRNSRAASTGTAENTLSDAIIVPSEFNLTDAGNNDLFECALASGELTGGTIQFTIIADDGTDKQSYTGMVHYSAVDKAGTLTQTITEVTANSALSTGTLTTVWSIVDGTNKITIRVVPTSSLTPTTMKIRYTINNNGTTAITQL